MKQFYHQPYNQPPPYQNPMYDQQYPSQCMPTQPEMDYPPQMHPSMIYPQANYNQPNQFYQPVYQPQPAPYYQPNPQPQPFIPIQPSYPAQPPPPKQQEANVKVEVKEQQTPAVITRESWTTSRLPTVLYCKKCQKEVTTLIVYEFGNGSCLLVLLFFLILWPCMCLPCCVPSMQDAIHHCPTCGSILGKNEVCS